MRASHRGQSVSKPVIEVRQPARPQTRPLAVANRLAGQSCRPAFPGRGQSVSKQASQSKALDSWPWSIGLHANHAGKHWILGRGQSLTSQVRAMKQARTLAKPLAVAVSRWASQGSPVPMSICIASRPANVAAGQHARPAGMPMPLPTANTWNGSGDIDAKPEAGHPVSQRATQSGRAGILMATASRPANAAAGMHARPAGMPMPIGTSQSASQWAI